MEIQPTSDYMSGDKLAVGTSASALRSICNVNFHNQSNKKKSSDDS